MEMKAQLQLEGKLTGDRLSSWDATIMYMQTGGGDQSDRVYNRFMDEIKQNGEYRSLTSAQSDAIAVRVLFEKFNQFPDLKQFISATGNAPIIYISKNQELGITLEGNGQNKLGTWLETARAKLLTPDPTVTLASSRGLGLQ